MLTACAAHRWLWLSSHSQEWGNWGPLLNRWSTTHGVYHNPPIESVCILKRVCNRSTTQLVDFNHSDVILIADRSSQAVSLSVRHLRIRNQLCCRSSVQSSIIRWLKNLLRILSLCCIARCVQGPRQLMIGYARA